MRSLGIESLMKWDRHHLSFVILVSSIDGDLTLCRKGNDQLFFSVTVSVASSSKRCIPFHP